MSKPSFDVIYMELAQKLAQRSHCVKMHVGAVLTKDTRIVSLGYNGPPAGTHNCDVEWPEHGCPRDSKGSCSLALHAEQNAIVNAARIGVSTKGCTMYMTCGMPCADCAKAIINAGIEKIVIEPNGTGSGAKDGIWTEHGLRSITMFIEAGMTIEYYGDKA